MNAQEIAAACRKIAAGPARVAFLAQACRGDTKLLREVEILLAGNEPETVEVQTGESEIWDSIERYFDELRELPKEERQSRLKQIQNPKVRDEVASLLKHAGDGATVEGVLGAMAAYVADSASEAAEQIGPYELVRKLGEGGMGIVYQARQHVPIRRDVALKVIKPGMDTRQIVARFESERQALAMMEHPNIARVLDAGATPGGRPYFVMELVHGVPITQYCDSKKLSPRERLELFIPVCQAIQHAHQKGIIHRDIKPSNILVTEADGKPIPKIIDFGIAKAVGPRISDLSQFTSAGSIVGTLEYMSPEQADGDVRDADTRSDIYSLGAVLYELLTGVTPLDSQDAIKATYLELLRRIREDEPVPPSSRIRSAQTMSEVFLRRRTDPGRLPKLLSGELDWIVMKALEKDRARRYETANGLGRDIERYLGGEAVEAGPPSAVYRLRKLAKKYRGALIAAGSFLLLLVVATALTTWQAIRANRAEQTAKAINTFLERDLLAQAGARAQSGPGQKADPNITVRTVLDRAAARLNGQFTGHPSVEASLRSTVGNTYGELGIYSEARRQYEQGMKALGSDAMSDRLGLRLAHSLGVVDWDDGKYAESEKRLLTVLEATWKKFGDEDPDTLETMDALALDYASETKYAEAEKVLVQALALSEKSHRDEGKTAETMWTLCQVYGVEGKYREAVQIGDRALAAARKAFGDDHPETLNIMGSLAENYAMNARYDEAEKMGLQVIEKQTKLLGAEHRDVISSKASLARCYLNQGKFRQAEAIYREMWEVCRRVKGPEHQDTLTMEHSVASALWSQGKFAEALPLIQNVTDTEIRVSGAENPGTLSNSDLLGAVLMNLGKLTQAEEIHTRSLRLERRILGDGHLLTLTTMNRLAVTYRAEGRLQDAENVQRESAEGLRKVAGPEHLYTVNSFGSLGFTYLLERRWVDAEQLLRPISELMEKSNSNLWQRYRYRVLIGKSLAEQGKAAEAEGLLLSGYQGMFERRQLMNAEAQSNLVLASQWIAELYEGTQRAGQAAVWRARMKQ